jgi:hypothetical protein
MRWTPGHRSDDVEDRRGASGARLGGAGTKLGLGGVVVVAAVVLLTGGDLRTVLGLLSGGGQGAPSAEVGDAPIDPANDPERELVEFMSFALDDMQAVWPRLLPTYQRAKLVLYRRGTNTGCGYGSSAVGPFYCPPDQKVYLDLSFFGELRRRFGAPGDFAQVYVLAHEIGHHVQQLTGQFERRDKADNQVSVRLELQADCYAGVWAHSTAQRKLIDQGDFAEAMRAAEAIGDDTLQQQAGGRVAPETFTHGSSAQRQRWFRRGYDNGDPKACDTFAVAQP